MKTVTVILTTYNSAPCIERTILSIQRQEGIGSAFALELIVIDDCSTDNTITILNNLGVSFTRTDQNSGGPNKGRNMGLKLASGDYICISDHDDEWKPHKLKTLLAYASGAPIITSGYTLIDADSGKITDRIKRSSNIESIIQVYERNETFRNKLAKSHTGQSTYLGSIMFSAALKSTLFEEHFGMVDFDWILRLFHQHHSIEVCEALYYRHVQRSNLSLEDSYRRYDFYYSLLTLEEYEQHYPKEVKIGYRKIYGSRARYYYLTGQMKKSPVLFYTLHLVSENCALLSDYLLGP